MSATLSSDSLASADAAVANLLSMSSRPLLPLMASWREQGWLRRLDVAFARFLVDLSPAAPDALVLAAALLVHMEGRGHSCLRLDDLLRDPQEIWAGRPSLSRPCARCWIHCRMMPTPGSRRSGPAPWSEPMTASGGRQRSTVIRR